MVNFKSCIFYYSLKRKTKEGSGNTQVLHLQLWAGGEGTLSSQARPGTSERGAHSGRLRAWLPSVLLGAHLGPFLGKLRKLADSHTSSSICLLWLCLIRKAGLRQRARQKAQRSQAFVTLDISNPLTYNRASEECALQEFYPWGPGAKWIPHSNWVTKDSLLRVCLQRCRQGLGNPTGMMVRYQQDCCHP